jgi:excisionase family DNA binding protein
MSDLISPQKAAKLIGVLPNTLRNWEEEGKITAIKTIGGHRRYKLNEINRLLDKSIKNNYNESK